MVSDCAIPRDPVSLNSGAVLELVSSQMFYRVFPWAHLSKPSEFLNPYCTYFPRSEYMTRGDIFTNRSTCLLPLSIIFGVCVFVHVHVCVDVLTCE